MAQGHSVDEYLETIYFLAFPIGEYRPQTGSPATLSARVAEMLGVSRASAGEMLKRLEAEGVASVEARRRALVAFGGVERYQQRVREARWTWGPSQASRDARLAVRALARRPLFALAAVGTIAVAIGAATTFFSVVEAVLLRPLPVPDPERLVAVEIVTRSGERNATVSRPDYLDYRTQAAGTVELAAQHLSDVTLSGEGGAARASLGLEVSGSWFGVLGLRPAVGRFFGGPRADRADAPAEAVLGHDVWVARFGSDPSVVGRTLRVNGHDLTVVGVVPEGFHGTLLGARPAVYVPLGLHPRLQGGDIDDRTGMEWLHLLGRLAPGATRERAAASLEVAARRLAAAHDYREQVEPDRVVVDAWSGLPPRVRGMAARFTLLLLAASMVLLLIAVVNVAGMLLARASQRGREIAVRLALGAGRPRLVGQLLAEGLVLGLLASGVGAAVAFAGTRLIEGVRPPGAPGFHVDLRIDGTVLAFALAAALLASLAFGLIPALHATRSDVAGALRRGGGGRARSRGRSALVGGQVALTLILLVSTVLLLRTVRNALAVDHGFDPAGLVLAEMDLRLTGHDEARGEAFYEALLERLRTSPAVASAALSTSYPLGFGWDQTRASVPGLEPPDPAGFPVGWSAVSDGYFETLGFPLRAGAPPDPRAPPLRVVVNEALATTFWGGSSPVGRQLRFGGRDATVAGVAPTGKYRSLSEEPALFAWVPLDYAYSPSRYVHVRPRGSAAAAMAALRSAVAELDPHVPLISVGTLEAAMGQGMFLQRAAAAMIGAFAAVGLLLSATGIFGLLAYTVEQRRREIGIRMAIGAGAREVTRSVVGRGLGPVLAGLGAGAIGALLAARAMEGLLYGVPALDPASFAAAAALLLGAALAAAWLPALRATRVEPAATLNAE
ncbi:MAG: ADOP family duplicated permease [Gemmatimonadetes bacterium]|nr:ADOP family duplicated permease [Gemmatimonadota bacterium]